jgi:deoxycytidylate deaminase
MNIPRIFRLAKNVSKFSTHRRCKLGAVIVINGTPIAVGTNKSKTNPNAPFTGLHAEISAIRNTGKTELRGSIIFVYRETKRGIIAMAKPCADCQRKLKEFGIKRVFYTTDYKDGFPFFEIEDYS